MTNAQEHELVFPALGPGDLIRWTNPGINKEFVGYLASRGDDLWYHCVEATGTVHMVPQFLVNSR